MPELINEGSVKRPLLVGAADPDEFIAQHAADADYWSEVAARRQALPTSGRELPAHLSHLTHTPGALLARLRQDWDPQPWAWQDPKTIDRLQWLYGGHYIRGEVTATAAAGGTGKSLLSIVEALAMVTGKPLLGERTSGSLKVMLVNYEDGALVLRQRVTAAIVHYKIRPEEIEGKLFVESISSGMMRFAKVSTEGVKIVEASVAKLTDVIERRGLDVVILDPWVSVHEVDGNLGHLVQPIITMLKDDIAQKTGVSLEIIAHPRKTGGKDLTEEDIAGALTLSNKLRDVRTLNGMTEEVAKKYGLAPWEAGDFFRADNPKHSHGSSTRPVWFRKVNVGLGNAGPGLFDRETSVGVVTLWTPPTAETIVAGMTHEQIEAIKAKVKAGLDREDQRADAWAGRAVAEVMSLDVVDEGQKAKAKATLTALIKAGHFKVKKRAHETVKDRKVKHLVPAEAEGPTGCVDDADGDN